MYDEYRNLTMATFWPQKARVLSRIPSYTLNSVLIILTLERVLRIYQDCAKESDRIRQLFVGNINDIETGITAIKAYSENVLAKKKNWKEKQMLKCANFFSTIYVTCCLAWTIAYAIEVGRTEAIITIGIIVNSVAHLCAYGSLVTIMWLTNKSIDDMKKAVLQKMSFEHQRMEFSAFKTLIECYDPYATLFTKKAYLSGIITTILTGFISLISPFIKSHLPIHW